MNPPTITVIVCCYTFARFDDTVAAINSVLGQTLRPSELIVSVDNNPELRDALRAVLPPQVIFVLNDAEGGESATRNIAIRAAQGDIVAFLDDDAVAEPSWLANIARPFEDGDVMVVGGDSVPAWERGRAPSWFPREFEFVVGCTGHLAEIVSDDAEIRNPAGSNMAVRRAAFDSLGGWERELGRGQVKTGGGEAELCLRIKSWHPAATVRHASDAVVHHKVSSERATLRYVFVYAFHEGGVRAKLRKFASNYSAQPLAGERLYLQRLFSSAIPRRMRTFWRPASLAQLTVILTNMLLVGVGYLRGRLIYR